MPKLLHNANSEKSLARLEAERKARTTKLDETNYLLSGLTDQRRALRGEFSSLEAALPGLTISALNGGGEEARNQLKANNARMREIEGEQAALVEAEKQLQERLKAIDSEAEADRIAQLEEEDAQLEEQAASKVASFDSYIDQAARSMDEIATIYARRVEIAKAVDPELRPRWRDLAIPLERYVAFRLGRRSGKRCSLEIETQAGVTGAFIARHLSADSLPPALPVVEAEDVGVIE